jgi:hypothetical protein
MSNYSEQVYSDIEVSEGDNAIENPDEDEIDLDIELEMEGVTS